VFNAYCRAYQGLMRLITKFIPWKRPEQIRDYISLVELLQKEDIRSVLVVTDANLTELDLHAELTQTIRNAGIHCALYDGTVQNPTIEKVEEALEQYRREKCTALIAFGGGSSIDCAKCVGIRVTRPNKSLHDLRGLFKVRRRIPLLIAVPTTAGSGSETTLAAVITDSQTHEKFIIIDPSIAPPFVFYDLQLTVSLSPLITAYTGMDALCHAVESYIGGSNTPQTRQDALEAAKLIFQSVYVAYLDGGNLTARANLQEAAFLAGAAFTRAYVGNIHAVAHTIGGRYNTAHGLANAVIMPYVLEEYGSKVYKTLSEMAVYAGIADDETQVKENAEAFIAAIRELNVKMGIPDKLSDLREEDIPVLASRALHEANPFYPVPVIFGRKEMEKVYYCVLKN